MITKIINNSKLNYKEIGIIIDKLNEEITTNYVGKISYYEMEINSKKVCIQTEIQKTQFKIYFCDKEDKWKKIYMKKQYKI